MAETLDNLFIHCSATREGLDLTGDDILKMHTAPKSEGGRGWKNPGYSVIFLLDGRIDVLKHYNTDDIVDPWEITNGVRGFNSFSRHICYIGGVDINGKSKDTRTDAQKKSMLHYVGNFLLFHPGVYVKGHNEVANKDCPCFDVKQWMFLNGLHQ